jgi:hypothetical protein
MGRARHSYWYWRVAQTYRSVPNTDRRDELGRTNSVPGVLREVTAGDTTAVLDSFPTGNPRAAVISKPVNPIRGTLTHGHPDDVGCTVAVAGRILTRSSRPTRWQAPSSAKPARSPRVVTPPRLGSPATAANSRSTSSPRRAQRSWCRTLDMRTAPDRPSGVRVD